MLMVTWVIVQCGAACGKPLRACVYGMCVRECECLCVRACVNASARVCMRAFLHRRCFVLFGQPFDNKDNFVSLSVSN